MSSKMQVLPLLAVLVGVGCSDATTTSAPRAIDPTAVSADRSARTPEKYVAIGTSLSMGWASNGVYAGSQHTAWPALLAFASQQPMSLPLIQSPGCTSPIVAPLGGGVRLSGESISGSVVCASNVQGVTLPTQDVGIAGALAVDAVQSTPESKGASAPWYARVLPPGATQLTAALAQQPTILTVELGGNEVLNATSGLLAPGVTFVPLPGFTVPYDALLDGLAGTRAKAVLVGLPADGRHLASLRRGAEIWADRAEFAALNVDVSNDCENNQNYINISQKSLTMVFTAAFTSKNGLPNPVYSCADIPGTVDFVMTPADIATLNALMGQMNDHIHAQAVARGYGFFTLGALMDRPELKAAPYSIIAQLTSTYPYSPYVSLDGVHPAPLGYAVLAAAAAFAFNAKYGGHDAGTRGAIANVRSSAPELSLGDVIDEPQLPAAALEQAKRIVAANAGRRLSACVMPVPGLTGC